MQQSPTGYNIIKGTGNDIELEQYRIVFQRNGTERDIVTLQWLHQQNIMGCNIIWYAMKGEEMAAISASAPIYMNFNGSILPGLHAVDSLTDKAHRGKKLFLTVYNKLYDDVRKDFVLTYGFPNEKSEHGFFDRLGWKFSGVVPFLVKPIGLGYFLKKLFIRKKHTDFSSKMHVFDAPETFQIDKNTVIRKINSFGDDYDKIWKKLAVDIPVSLDRSSVFMNWRYINNPAEFYSCHGLYINDKLAGIVILSIKYKHGGRVGYLMELLYDPEYKKAGRQMLKFANKQFKKQKADIVLTWCNPGSFNYKSYRKSGYYPLPEILRPQELYMGAIAFDRSKAAVIEDMKKWYLSYSDSDTS